MKHLLAHIFILHTCINSLYAADHRLYIMEPQPTQPDSPMLPCLPSTFKLCREPKSEITNNTLTLTGQLPYDNNNIILKGPLSIHHTKSYQVALIASIACAEMLLRNAQRNAKKAKQSVTACTSVWWEVRTEGIIPDIVTPIQRGVGVITTAFPVSTFTYCVNATDTLPEDAILQVSATFNIRSTKDPHISAV